MKTYDPEVKAQVMAILLTGQSVSSIAKEYNLPKGTVSSWRKQAERDALGVESKSTQKSREMGELILQYLEANLDALRMQAIAFQNPEWLHKQNAADAAVLHGVMTDKAVRLLEAMSRDDANDNAAQS